MSYVILFIILAPVLLILFSELFDITRNSIQRRIRLEKEKNEFYKKRKENNLLSNNIGCVVMLIIILIILITSLLKITI